MKNHGKTCPSANFSKGAYLLGIRNEDDEMEILAEPLKITEEIYNKLKKKNTRPEKALRMANKCIESNCKQWTGEGCGVIDHVLTTIEERYKKDQLPECGIRSTCRWYSQQGKESCKVCTLVTTLTEEIVEE